MLNKLGAGWRALLARFGGAPLLPDALWQQVLSGFPLLRQLPAASQQRLRMLTGQFLTDKEFTGARGLTVSDEMAVAIAAQACLPILNMGPKGLALYRGFKGIVVHPGAMLARRRVTDAAGVVHHYTEVLAGEAMDKGPVTLSWEDVASAARPRAADSADGADSADTGSLGHNVVIHEFIHKMDMADGPANGCPPLPSRAARQAWQATMTAAYERFRQQVVMADRFGAPPPWLDTYGAQSPVEFFAVAGEAYFVNRARFAQDFADVTALFDGYFRVDS